MYPFLLLFDLCFFQVFQEKKKNQIYGPSIVVVSFSLQLCQY